MKEFYVTKLGLEVLEDFPKVLALRAGDVRFSFFLSETNFAEQSRVQVILRTTDILESRSNRVAAGIEVEEEIIEAPNFMKFFVLDDPDGNSVYIAEYLRNPLLAL